MLILVEDRNDSSKPFASTVGAARPASSLYNPPSPNPNASSSGTFTALGASASASAAAAAAGSWATEGVASLLRLSASETNTLASSVETLRDLFWTLYSKLDAVLQGFRVSYEVASRISEVRSPSSLRYTGQFADPPPMAASGLQGCLTRPDKFGQPPLLAARGMEVCSAGGAPLSSASDGTALTLSSTPPRSALCCTTT